MKKTIKGIIIGTITVVLVIIIAGIYKFNYLANQPGYDVDGNKIEDTPKSEVLLKWFNLDTPNSFYVKIPDTNIECEIIKLTDSNSSSLATGYYVIGEEKGTVFINNSDIVALNQPTKNIEYLVIPFSISNQGSGLFKYLGTFSIDYKTKTINQIDSYYLGDRIKVNSIKYDGTDNLHVELNIHSESQPMSDPPSKLKVLNLKVDNGTILGTEWNE